jgi:hypothetical protein
MIFKFVFDFDETLVHCKDIEAEKQSLFLDLKNIEIIPAAIKIFNKTRKHHETFILTNRHPLLKSQIAGMMNIDESNVICRDYCLTNEEMKLVNSDKESEEKFLVEMAKYKINSLKKIQAETQSEIIFFDDMANRMFEEGKELNHIHIRYPLVSIKRYRELMIEINSEELAFTSRSLLFVCAWFGPLLNISKKSIISILYYVLIGILAILTSYFLSFRFGYRIHVFRNTKDEPICPNCFEKMNSLKTLLKTHYQCNQCDLKFSELTIFEVEQW